VPPVATILKPSSSNIWAAGRMPSLSRSLTEMNTVPDMGSRWPAASWLFMKARPKFTSMPMTSPVERISGPSSTSTPGKRLKGNTDSLTDM